MSSIHPSDLFDLSDAGVARMFDGCDAAWDMIPRISEVLRTLLNGRRVIRGRVDPGAVIGDGPAWIEKGAVIETGTLIIPPVYIAAGASVRHGAYIRGDVVLLERSVLGHAGEAKNALFLPGAKAPHFAYVGDSVLGNDVNLGAGTKLSNLPVTSRKDHLTGARPTIELKVEGRHFDTGLSKFGAILGDGVQTGCNVVVNPGVVIGARTLVYPNATLSKGVYPSDVVVKVRQQQIVVQRQ